MNQEEQLQKANEALKQIHIKQAIPQGFEFNPAYTPDIRETMLTLSIQKKLDALNAAIIVDKGEAKVVRKDNPDLELYDQAQNRVTLQQIVGQAIIPLGNNAYQASDGNSNYYQQISDTEYIKGEHRYTKTGNNNWTRERIKPLVPQARTFKEHHEQLTRELGINP
jgi:hypothetical protein